MKRNMLPVLILLIFACLTCQKEPVIRFGFDADFGENSRGLSIMLVDRTSRVVSLKGEIVVMEGQVLVELISPQGEVVFNSLLPAPENLYVNESFPAVPGNWKLRYQSMEGTGLITLHMNAYSQNLQK